LWFTECQSYLSLWGTLCQLPNLKVTKHPQTFWWYRSTQEVPKNLTILLSLNFNYLFQTNQQQHSKSEQYKLEFPKCIFGHFTRRLFERSNFRTQFSLGKCSTYGRVYAEVVDTFTQPCRSPASPNNMSEIWSGTERLPGVNQYYQTSFLNTKLIRGHSIFFRLME